MVPWDDPAPGKSRMVPVGKREPVAAEGGERTGRTKGQTVLALAPPCKWPLPLPVPVLLPLIPCISLCCFPLSMLFRPSDEGKTSPGGAEAKSKAGLALPNVPLSRRDKMWMGGRFLEGSRNGPIPMETPSLEVPKA